MKKKKEEQNENINKGNGETWLLILRTIRLDLRLETKPKVTDGDNRCLPNRTAISPVYDHPATKTNNPVAEYNSPHHIFFVEYFFFPPRPIVSEI